MDRKWRAWEPVEFWEHPWLWLCGARWKRLRVIDFGPSGSGIDPDYFLLPDGFLYCNKSERVRIDLLEAVGIPIDEFSRLGRFLIGGHWFR